MGRKRVGEQLVHGKCTTFVSYEVAPLELPEMRLTIDSKCS